MNPRFTWLAACTVGSVAATAGAQSNERAASPRAAGPEEAIRAMALGTLRTLSEAARTEKPLQNAF